MKAISNKQHRSLIAALQQLEALQEAGNLPTNVQHIIAGGFLSIMQSLNEQFNHYEVLLSELAEAIALYDALYRDIRTSVVAPALRQMRKQPNNTSTEHLAAVQGF